MSGSTPTFPGDCLQLQILKALTTHLEGINNVPVFKSDTLASLTGRVFRGRALFGAEQGPDPMISLIEGRKPDEEKDEVTGEDEFTILHRWHILLQGWQKGDPANPTDYLYNFKALVEQRLALLTGVNQRGGLIAPQYYLLNGLLININFKPGTVRPNSPTQGVEEAFYLPIVISYGINLTNPFVGLPLN